MAHVNEALTMCARLAAVTGDERWVSRYGELEPILDNGLVQMAMSARTQYEQNYAAQVKLSYTKIIEIETLAFALVRQGRIHEAQEILFSKPYERQKQLYAQGLERTTTAVQERITQQVQSFRSRIHGMGLLATVSFVLLFAGGISLSLALKRHLARRQHAEKELAKEKEQLLVTLQSIREGVICTDVRGTVVTLNPMAEELTGWSNEEALAKPIGDVLRIEPHGGTVEPPHPVREVLDSGELLRLPSRWTLLRKDGRRIAISASAAPLTNEAGTTTGVVLVFRDMTDEMRVQDELVKHEKLESVGLLAGGIAHDFNNILTGILGHISLVRTHSTIDDTVKQRLSQAEYAANRARDLTRQLLIFSQGGGPVKKITAIRNLITDWTTFALRGANVRAEYRIADNLWHCDIDEGQISQVLNNLVINAVQAMPDGGSVHVSAENVTIPPGHESALSPGEYVHITVRDEGSGIPESELKRIFDPYYTTKEFGTGLGLATSYSTVRSHNGMISVESQLGVGTIFSVYLPASRHKQVRPPDRERECSPGHGRILVMDDDPAIRGLARDMLEMLGYDAFAVEGGRQAVGEYERALATVSPFRAVIMDLTVPGGMGGREAVSRILELDPQAKCIVSSGYSNDPVMADYEQYGFVGILPKPYCVKEVGEVLRRALNGNSIDKRTRRAGGCSS
jgi:PAS domain S-box-containing protein